MTTDRVLESIGTWNFGKQEREFLTIMDILQIMDKEVNSGKVSVAVSAPKTEEPKEPVL